VLNGFGMTRLFAGVVEEALDLLLESVQQADHTDDKALRVAVRYGLCFAYWTAGRLRECLAVTQEGLGLAQGDLGLGADQVGFSPSLGFSFFHGSVLTLTGSPRDGAVELDRVIALARASQQLILVFIIHFYHVLRCDLTGEAATALAHAREAMDYAERIGSQHGRIQSYLGLATANLLNGAWHDALEVLGTALKIGRERRILINEGSMLAAMAAAHLGLGGHDQALVLADEAIAVCHQGGSRIWELPALLTRMRALRETQGLEAVREIEKSLAQCDAWLGMTGAKSYEPFLHVERAELARLIGDEASRQRELREAHRLFTEIGAPIRAAEVAKELGL
jgi:hypothetical protein